MRMDNECVKQWTWRVGFDIHVFVKSKIVLLKQKKKKERKRKKGLYKYIRDSSIYYKIMLHQYKIHMKPNE